MSAFPRHKLTGRIAYAHSSNVNNQAHALALFWYFESSEATVTHFAHSRFPIASRVEKPRASFSHDSEIHNIGHGYKIAPTPNPTPPASVC